MITEAVDLNADDDAVQHIAVACLSSDDLALDTFAIFREHEGAGFSFQGVADTIGTNSIPNVQRYPDEYVSRPTDSRVAGSIARLWSH